MKHPSRADVSRSGVDLIMGRKPWASALRLISRNALASGSARLKIDAFEVNIHKSVGGRRNSLCFRDCKDKEVKWINIGVANAVP